MGVAEDGNAETFVLINVHHVIVAVTKLVLTLYGMKIGAAVMSLAKDLVKKVNGVGVKVETAAVAKFCLSASRVKEGAMTIVKTYSNMPDLTYLVSQ